MPVPETQELRLEEKELLQLRRGPEGNPDLFERLNDQLVEVRRNLTGCFAMPETPDELRQLAEQVAAIDDEDVIDSAAAVAALYKRERSRVDGHGRAAGDRRAGSAAGGLPGAVPGPAEGAAGLGARDGKIGDPRALFLREKADERQGQG